MNIGQIVAEITATTTGLRKATNDANKQFQEIQGNAEKTNKIVNNDWYSQQKPKKKTYFNQEIKTTSRTGIK